MSEAITFRSETHTELSPADLAAIFVNMHDGQQAEFFVALGKEFQQWEAKVLANAKLGAGNYAAGWKWMHDVEWQMLAVKEALNKHPDKAVGVKALQQLSAWFWLHWQGDHEMAVDILERSMPND